VATLSPDQQDQNQNQAPATGGVPISGTAGGVSSSGKGGAGQAASAPVSNVQQNAGAQNQQGYTDVGAYLNANQAGTQQMGGKVADNLTNQYNQTKQGIDTSSQAFQGAANSGYTPENTDLIKQVASDPTAAAADKGLSSGYTAQLNDQYTGPTNWSDLGTLQGTVAQANQTAGLVNTPGGTNVLAQQIESPMASQGVNSLDAMLLGAPNAQSQMQAAAQPFSTLNDYLNAQNTAGLGMVTQGQNAAQQASSDALNAFTGANGTLTGLNTNINQAASKANADSAAQQAQLKADIGQIYGGQAVNNTASSLGTYGGGTTPWANTQNYNVNAGALSPQDLQAMGITQDQWNQLSGAMSQAGTSQDMHGHNFGAGSGTSQIDLNQFLNSQAPNATAGTVATPQQYQQMAAIQSLLGSKNPQGNAINPDMASQAGTYNPNGGNQFDFAGALSGAQNTAQDERDAAQQEANAISGQGDLAHAQSQHGGGLFSSMNNFLQGAAPWAANAPLQLGKTSLQEAKKVTS
jgi:hypothetical protein